MMYSELHEALKLYKHVGKDVVYQRSARLSGIFRKKLEALFYENNIEFDVLNKTDNAPLLSIALHDYNPFSLYSYLNDSGIHCKCMIDHKDGESTYHILRFGLPYYETEDRLEQVINEMKRPLAVSQKEYLQLENATAAA
jgi:UDP-sulfoquinovose synthase